jgi:acetyl-CoA decarbonylase/synthase complex subunit epsilon
LATVIPWEKGNIFGPKTAMVSKGDVVGRLIKSAKRPLLIVGAKILEDDVGGKPLLNYVIELSKAANIPVVATAHTLKPLVENGLRSPAAMGMVEITDRLRDPSWSLDGKGPHDIVVLAGITYQLQSQMLSTLKNFAAHLKTISLDRYYTPNADWSFPNLDEKSWAQDLDKLIKAIKLKQ